jgi:hypothetical protein
MLCVEAYEYGFVIVQLILGFYLSYVRKMLDVWGRRGGRIGCWWVNRRERDHWGDLGVDGWIILGWISRRWDVGMWTGLG